MRNDNLQIFIVRKKNAKLEKVNLSDSDDLKSNVILRCIC